MAIVQPSDIDGKTCTKCGQYKPFSSYSPRKNRRSGWHSWCRDCMNAASRLKEAEHPGTDAAYKRRERLLHPERNAIVCRQYTERHPERVKESARRKHAKQPDKYRALAKHRTQVYRDRYPDMMQARYARRRADKLGAIGSFTGQEWQELKARYGFECLACHKSEPEIKLTVDHVIPMSKGGTNSIENIQPLCIPCNVRKSNRDTDYRPALPTRNS